VGSMPPPALKPAKEPWRSEDDAPSAARRRVRRLEGDLHHDRVGRAVQDAPVEEEGAPATVNRELAWLKRMFRLGLRQGMVATMPEIAMLAEHNVRKGFFELDRLQAILKHLASEPLRRGNSPTR